MATPIEQEPLPAQVSDERVTHAARASLRLVSIETATPSADAYIDDIDNEVLRAMLRGLSNVGQRLPEL